MKHNSWLTPWDISCEGNGIVGDLRHNFLNSLKVTCIIRPPEEVVAAWAKEKRWAHDENFDKYMKEAHDLANSLEEMFSPAQLIDGELKQFFHPEECARIKKAVHEAYYESSGIKPLKKPLQQNVKALAKHLNFLRNIWFLPKTNEEAIKSAYKKVQESAEALQKKLNQLPTGAVLP